MDRTSRCSKVDAVRLFASYRLNLLLLRGVEVRDLALILYIISLFTHRNERNSKGLIKGEFRVNKLKKRN